jgi:hypothetical protein
VAKKTAVIEQDFDKSELALILARNQVGEKLAIEDLLENHGILPKTAEQYLNDPMFVADVRRLAKQLTESGQGFEAKCRILAEDVLKTTYNIIQDSDTPAATRMKGIENLVEWGGLKPKPSANQLPGAGGGFTIQIVIPQAVQQAAIAEGVQDATRIPVVIDQEPEATEDADAYEI